MMKRFGRSANLRGVATRLKGGASVAALVLGATAAQAQTPPATAGIVSGSSRTTVTGTDNMVVTTTNLSADGKTAFNRFTAFDVAAAKSATLVLPDASTTLVNVVSSNIRVDGTLTSTLASAAGAVGGNLYFITAGGFAVGAGGVVNTGRLIVRGPDSAGNLLNTDALSGQGFGASSLDRFGAAGAIVIDGRVNAPGGVDLRGSSVRIGGSAVLATGAAGHAAVQAAQGGALVSTAGITEGAALVRVNGGIAIVGAESASIASGALLDARAVAWPAGGPALGGGIDILSRDITANGTLRAWDGASATAGNVNLIASETALADSGLVAQLLANYFKGTTAQTRISVGGAISGGAVTIRSDATATTPEGSIAKTAVGSLIDKGVNVLLGAAGIGLDAIFVRSQADTQVTLGAGATVNARGDVTIAAESKAAATGSAYVRVGNDKPSGSSGDDEETKPWIGVGIGVAQLISKADVKIDGSVTAGGRVSVTAANDATSALKVRAVSTDEAIAAAVAYSDITVAANVAVGAGASLTGGSVAIDARNMQAAADKGFVSSAIALAKEGAPGGGAVGIMNLDIGADADVKGTITANQAVNGSTYVTARTVTNKVANAVSTDVKPTSSGALDTVTNIQFTGGTSALMGDGMSLFKGKFNDMTAGGSNDASQAPAGGSGSGGSSGGGDEDPDLALKFGASVGIVLNNQRANASVTGTVNAVDLVEVTSRVEDTTVRNNISAKVNASKKKDGEDAITVSGAAAWANSDYTSHAVLGGTVNAGKVAVRAVTDRPRGDSIDDPFESTIDPDDPSFGDLKNFAKEAYEKLSPFLSIEKGFFTNSAGAIAKSDSNTQPSLSGSISYSNIDADTRAWINPTARLTLSGTLDVKAQSDIMAISLGGPIPIGITGPKFASQGGNAGGITIAFSSANPNTVAGIGKGVLVQRAAGADKLDVNVDALSTVRLLTLAPNSGLSNAITGTGSFAINLVDGATRAVVSKDSKLDLGTGGFGLNAQSGLEVWAVGGSLALTNANGTGNSGTTVSIGVSGAVNYAELDTKAKVGDAGSDDDAATAQAAAAAVNAGITAANVTILANTTGSINALSVAGTGSKNSQQQPKSTDNGPSSKPKGFTGKLSNGFNLAKGGAIGVVKKGESSWVDYTKKYAADAANAANQASNDALSKGTPVTRGLGVAGSASVNIALLGTAVETTGATFINSAPAATSRFRARATEGVDMLSVTGGAALSYSDKPQESNSLLAGAYGLSYSDNRTRSAVNTTTVSGFGSVDVEAAANGSRIAAGLALAIDATKSEEGLAFAGSMSHLASRDQISATVTDSSLTGTGTGAGGGNVSVLAYDGLTMGAGAGGLAFTKGNASMGGAITVVDIQTPGGHAADARLVRTPVTQFNDLTVRALTAARIVGIAAAGAVNAAKESDNSAAVSMGLSLNLVSMSSNALIDTGSDGRGSVNVGNSVNVFAGDRDPNVDEQIAAVGKTPGTFGSSMLGSYNIAADDISGDDRVSVSDLKGGTQIVSFAVPISAARGQAFGLGFAWNEIDNDRTAAIIGGASAAGVTTIRAPQIAVNAIDRSDILAVAVGAGGSLEGVTALGSATRNLIGGSSSAAIGTSAGAANRLVVEITGAPAATPNLSIGASGDGGIFALAGGIGYGKTGAAGVAAAVNEIVRDDQAPTGGVGSSPNNAGLYASAQGVAFKGTPNAAITADNRARVISTAFAVAASQENAAVAAAASGNHLAPTLAAKASGLTYLDATTGDLKITAKDSSTIVSTAAVLGASGSGGYGAGISVNRIDADVQASLSNAAGDRVRVRNLIVGTEQTSGILTVGLGVGGGSSYGGAGSVAINVIEGDVDSLVNFTGGEITTTGSLGVIAKRDATVDNAAGVLAASAGNFAGGASLIVNVLAGSSRARIVGSATNAGTINAFTGSGGDDGRTIAGLRTGTVIGGLPQFESFDLFSNAPLTNYIRNDTATMKGIVVNASSNNAVRNASITGAFAGGNVAVGVTGVVSNVLGETVASVTDAKLSAGSGTAVQDGVTVDVRASSQAVATTFAGAVAAGSNFAAAAPVIADGLAGKTEAKVSGGSIASTDSVNVKAVSNQAATALALAGAVATSSVGVSVAGVSPRFQAETLATVDRPTALTALGHGVAIDAQSDAKALATFGSLAIGNQGAGAGAMVVVVNQNATRANYLGRLDPVTGLGTVDVAAPSFAVRSEGNFDTLLAGASIAGSAGVSIVANGVGVVHLGEVSALADGLKYNNAAGAVTVRAAEAVSLRPVVGAVSAGFSLTGGGATFGLVAALSQSKVDATLARPTVSANTVNVQAVGYNLVDVLQMGLAIGSFAGGANVTYIGVGAVGETGALFASTSGQTEEEKEKAKVAEAAGSDGQGGNRNLTQLASGGTSASTVAGQSGRYMTDSERQRAAAGSAGTAGSGASAFATVSTPGDGATARVRAQVTDVLRAGATASNLGLSSVHAADTLTIDSDANVRSRSTNVAGSIGLFTGTATIDVSRNAAQSNAYLGNVAASGGTLNLTATTGQAKAPNAPGTVTDPQYAADSQIYAGSVGIGIAMVVGVSDVTLESTATAESRGAIGFTTANIKADDLTVGKAFVVGAVPFSSNAINVGVATAKKSGTIAATVGGSSTSRTLNVTADAQGAVSAEAYGGANGLFLAGNAAIATAVDDRTVRAVIAEASRIASPNLNLLATITPSVTARTFGISRAELLTIGASVSTAVEQSTVRALVGEGTVLDCVDTDGCRNGVISVRARAVQPATGANVVADAHSSAGGTMLVLNGSVATADNRLNVGAVVGADLDATSAAAVTLPVSKLVVEATRDVSTQAKAFGVTIAGLASLSGQVANAKSSGTTRAAIENVAGRNDIYFGTTGAYLSAGDLTVRADALDRNSANAVAGGGALGAALAALATTDSRGDAVAEVLNAPGRTLRADILTVTAESGADYRSDSTSVLATVLGGSGTSNVNTVATNATVNIGQAGLASGTNSRLEASEFHIRAHNIVGEAATDGGTAKGAGGGVLTGSAALLANTVVQNATVNVRDGVTLRQYGGNVADNTRATFIDAAVTTNRTHQLALEIGGLMQLPKALLAATYDANNAVNIGRNVLIRGDQGIGVGTMVRQTIVDANAAQIYGLAGIGGASSFSTSKLDQRVAVGDGTAIESMMDIGLTAGTDATGYRNDLVKLAVQTDTFNWTAVPLTTEAAAVTTLLSDNRLALGAATIRSARGVVLSAVASDTVLTAAGSGHNPYLEIFRQTIDSGETIERQNGIVRLDGTAVTAGFLSDRTIGFTDNGSGGVTVTTNDAVAYPTLDPDRLGQFVVSTKAFDTTAYLSGQIAALTTVAQGRGISVPADPNGFPAGSGQRANAEATLASAAATSDVIAQLASLYQTRAALQANPRGANVADAVVVGGTIGTNGQLDGVGAVYAAGGVVKLNADTVQNGARAASVTARTAGNVTITNSTARDLILGDIYIPVGAAGSILYGGKATALPAGITASIGGANAAIGQVTARNTSGSRADMIALGSITNLTGGFAAGVPNGNFVQFGAVSVSSFAADIPNGLFSVSMPSGTFSQGLPYAYWYGQRGITLNPQAGQSYWTGNEAIEALASYLAMKRMGVADTWLSDPSFTAAYRTFAPGSTADPMYELFLHPKGYADLSGNPRSGSDAAQNWSILWQGCATRCEIISADSVIRPANSSGALQGWQIQEASLGFSNIGGQYGGSYWTPRTFYRAPVITDSRLTGGSYGGQGANPATANAITANQVLINAQYVDISGKITAGPTKERSLTIHNQITSSTTGGPVYLGSDMAAYGQDVINLAATRFMNGNIGAQFIRTGVANGVAQGYIQVDDVDAGAGGLISITGKILNTNPLSGANGGLLTVRNGFANIAITNNSGFDLHLGTLNAGTSVAGKIVLTDIDGSNRRVTEYTSTAGQGIYRSTTLNGSVVEANQLVSAGGQGSGADNPLYYTPSGRYYYVWDESRGLHRDSFDSRNLTEVEVGPWQWTASTQPGVGRFVNIADTGNGEANRIRTALDSSNERARGEGDPRFVQLTDGYVTNVWGGFNDVGFNNGKHSFVIPLDAVINLKTAVTATNPIGIVFDQGSGGGIAVRSNAGGSIVMNGNLTYGVGDIYLAASDSSLIQSATSQITARSFTGIARYNIGTVADPFRVNLKGGTVTAGSYYDLNLKVDSVSTSYGALDPVQVGSLTTAYGSIRLTSNSRIEGVGWGLSAPGDIVLTAAGSIGGWGMDLSRPFETRGLAIQQLGGKLIATAGGDIGIDFVDPGYGERGPLKIGAITTPGDVQIRSYDSVVAADATATIDPEKLARFTAAARALQLEPACASACGTIDVTALGALDAAMRAEAYAAYDQLSSDVPGAFDAAAATLTRLFGAVPASRSAIATQAIGREQKIAYQARTEGRQAYDLYVLTNPAAFAENSRGTAAAQALSYVDALNALAAKPGVSVSLTAGTIVVTDAAVAGLQPGGELYALAAAALQQRGQNVSGTLSQTELQRGLQFHAEDLRTPVAALLPATLPNLAGLTATERATAIAGAISGSALADWVSARALADQRAMATNEAVGRIAAITALGANAGVSLSGDARTLTVTDFSIATFQPGGALYTLAVSTLRNLVGADGTREALPLPTQADVQRGLQVYLDSLRAPIALLLPGALPTLTGDATSQRTAVSNAISGTALAAWTGQQQASATARLTALFGTVPTSRTAIDTAAIRDMGTRTTGATWSRTMLDFAVPSTAFVPVADTQFETRKSVINARSVSILAGDSIGAFDAARSFTFNTGGFTGLAADKDLATAYLASAGPGDLTLDLTRDGTGKVTAATFTTRRDQPLTINAAGTVNAAAGLVVKDYWSNAQVLVGTITDPDNSPVLGNIFLTNLGTLNVGTIVSAKGKGGTPVGSCAFGTAAAATCDSRIRLVAPSITGVASGAARIDMHDGTTSVALHNADRSGVVMGGLIRMEASTGSIGSRAPGGALTVDAGVLEVLRADQDIRLVKRAPVTLPGASWATTSEEQTVPNPACTPFFGGFNCPAGEPQTITQTVDVTARMGYRAGNDLIVGDVFAGNRFQLDNPVGSLLVGRIPSILESENRNSRIVAGILALRAAGDLGSADTGATGIVGQFDITAPVIDQMVAGYDYATGTPGEGPAPAGLAPGNGYFAFRGSTQIGGLPGSILGARGDLTLGSIDGFGSSVTFLSNILVGGIFNLTTDGDVDFANPDIRITSLGAVYDENTVDLSKLSLNLRGRFSFLNTRSIILGSLTAGGGTIESTQGSVTVNGTLFGNGGPETPFTLKGRTGVTAGSVGLGAVALYSSHGDVALTGSSYASDLTMSGNNVSVAGSILGRSATLAAGPSGGITIGGTVMLARDAARPEVAANLTMTGRDLTLGNALMVQDRISVVAGDAAHAGTITTTDRALFMNSGEVILTAGTLDFNPNTMFANVGRAVLTAGAANAGGAAVRLPGFSGGTLIVDAPTGIVAGAIDTAGAVSFRSSGTITIDRAIRAGDLVTLDGRLIAFSATGGVGDSSGLSLTASDAIIGAPSSAVFSRGSATITAGVSGITLSQVRAGTVSLKSDGAIALNGGLASDIGGISVQAGSDLTLGGNVTSAGDLTIDGHRAVSLYGPVSLLRDGAMLDLTAGSTLTLGRNARIVGVGTRSAARVMAATVDADPLAMIVGMSVNLTATGSATLGDVRANQAAGQSVALRTGGALSVGSVTGAAVTLSATGGGLTARGAIAGNALTLIGRDDVATNGLTGTSATIASSLGNVALRGATRIANTASPTAARLTVTAGAGKIGIEGLTSATGGVTMTGTQIATVGAGKIGDSGLLGALTTLRADTIDVTFDTGGNTGAAMRIDARGRSTSNVNDAVFRFTGTRAVQFDALYANRATLRTAGALNIAALNMRDWLLIGLSGADLALAGATTPPPASRTVATGALTGAKLVATPKAGAAPTVTVNGTAR